MKFIFITNKDDLRQSGLSKDMLVCFRSSKSQCRPNESLERGTDEAADRSSQRSDIFISVGASRGARRI